MRALLNTTGLILTLAAAVSLGGSALLAQSTDVDLPDGGHVGVHIGDSEGSVSVNIPSIGFGFSDSFSFGSGDSGTSGADSFSSGGTSSPLGGKTKSKKVLPTHDLSTASRTDNRGGGTESASRDLAASISGGADDAPGSLGATTTPLLVAPPTGPALAETNSTGPAVNAITGAGTASLGGGGVLNPANEGALTKGIVKDAEGNIIAYKGHTFTTHPHSQQIARMMIKADQLQAVMAGMASAELALEFEAISRDAGMLATAVSVVPAILGLGTTLAALATETVAAGSAAVVLGTAKATSIGLTARNSYLDAKTRGYDDGKAAVWATGAAGVKALTDLLPASDDMYSIQSAVWDYVTKPDAPADVLGNVFYGQPSETINPADPG